MIVRSTVDVVARLLFVLRGGGEWEKLKQECGPLPADITDIDMRALLHHASEGVKTTKKLNASPAFDIQNYQKFADDVNSIVGDEWFKQLGRGMGFLNIGLENLCRSIGLDPDWKLVYSLSSQVIHGGGATNLLSIDSVSSHVAVEPPDLVEAANAVRMCRSLAESLFDQVEVDFGNSARRQS